MGTIIRNIELQATPVIPTPYYNIKLWYMDGYWYLLLNLSKLYKYTSFPCSMLSNARVEIEGEVPVDADCVIEGSLIIGGRLKLQANLTVKDSTLLDVEFESDGDNYVVFDNALAIYIRLLCGADSCGTLGYAVRNSMIMGLGLYGNAGIGLALAPISDVYPYDVTVVGVDCNGPTTCIHAANASRAKARDVSATRGDVVLSASSCSSCGFEGMYYVGSGPGLNVDGCTDCRLSGYIFGGSNPVIRNYRGFVDLQLEYEPSTYEAYMAGRLAISGIDPNAWTPSGKFTGILCDKYTYQCALRS